MDAVLKIFGIVLFIAIFVAPLYYKIIAPHYKIRVKILDKGFTTGVRPVFKGYEISRLCNYFWGEFQVTETEDIMKLGMDVNLYTAIKKGQCGILTYRKGYAISFLRTGTIKRRKPSFGEKKLDDFKS